MELFLKVYTKFPVLIVFLMLIGGIVTKTSYAGKKEMEKRICIIPIGSINKEILQYTQKELEGRFNVKIDIGKPQEAPNYAYNKRREQFHSTLILKRIYNQRLGEYDRILGIVDADLYVPELTFVFGEADIARKMAVISLTRLKQEFYGMQEDIVLFNRRIITEAVHELGHTYGFCHCPNNNCVMYFSNTLSDTDRKGSVFCNTCKKAIKKGKIENVIKNSSLKKG